MINGKLFLFISTTAIIVEKLLLEDSSLKSEFSKILEDFNKTILNSGYLNPNFVIDFLMHILG